VYICEQTKWHRSSDPFVVDDDELLLDCNANNNNMMSSSTLSIDKEPYTLREPISITHDWLAILQPCLPTCVTNQASAAYVDDDKDRDDDPALLVDALVQVLGLVQDTEAKEFIMAALSVSSTAAIRPTAWAYVRDSTSALYTAAIKNIAHQERLLQLNAAEQQQQQRGREATVTDTTVTGVSVTNRVTAVQADDVKADGNTDSTSSTDAKQQHQQQQEHVIAVISDDSEHDIASTNHRVSDVTDMSSSDEGVIVCARNNNNRTGDSSDSSCINSSSQVCQYSYKTYTSNKISSSSGHQSEHINGN
jgi:hypothetical protein